MPHLKFAKPRPEQDSSASGPVGSLGCWGRQKNEPFSDRSRQSSTSLVIVRPDSPPTRYHLLVFSGTLPVFWRTAGFLAHCRATKVCWLGLEFRPLNQVASLNVAIVEFAIVPRSIRDILDADGLVRFRRNQWLNS